MARHVAVKINIPGASKEIKTFHSLTIQQNLGAHHQFELRLPVNVLDPDGNPDNIYKSQHIMGEVITVQFGDSKSPDTVLSKFRGVITEVVLNKHKGAHGDLVLRGYSPTIVLENGPHYASFSEKKLGDIVKQMLGKFQANFINSSGISPSYAEQILYSVQYNESTFNYLKRLSNDYGEWFYYDGDVLRMGPPPSGTEIKLNFGQDVSDMNFSLKIVPLNFKKTGYDYKADKQETVKSADAPKLDTALGKYGKEALDEADAVFQFETNFHSSTFFATNKTITDEVRTLKNQRAAEMMVLSGSSDNAELTLGSTIDIAATTEASKGFKSEPFGKYIITGVMHRTDGAGNYQNFFHGVPNTIKQPPLLSCIQPLCETETGVVTDNKDPDKFGRIQVQLRWQSGQEKTPFIRNLTPYSGKNRGINFNAEIGDEVLVGYADNDPDHPMVMGSFKNKSSMYSDDKFQVFGKYLTSVYNQLVLWDESDSKHGLSLSTFKSKTEGGGGGKINKIDSLYDGGKGTILAQAKDKITLKAPTIELLATEIYLNGSKLIDMKSNEKIHAKAGQEINIECDMKITQKATTDFKIEGLKIEMNATTDFKVHGLKVEVKADTQMAIEGAVQASLKGGAQLEMSGGAMATLKGGMVMIN